MSVTFDSVALTQPEQFEEDHSPETEETTLHDGRKVVDINTNAGIRVTFTCNTAQLSDITALRAKIGTLGTLVIDGTSYTSCYIAGFRTKKISTTYYEYTVEFKQQTA